MAGSALPFSIATFGGLLLWTATAVAGGRAEPWDSPLYWTVSYPAALAFCLVLGLVFPERPWRWALVLIGSQLLVMAFSSPGLGLLPLGLVMLGILSLPGVVLARIGGRIGRRAGD